MKGLHLGFTDTYIKRARYDSTSFELLASGNGAEVVMQSIKEGKYFCVHPGEKDNLFEFFYIVEGKCGYQERNATTILKAGNYFYANQLEDVGYFRVLKDMKVLWFSTQPFFHTVNSIMETFTETVKKIEKSDKYTYHHSLRVQEYSFKIAKELGLSLEVISDVFDAAALHDIGKIKVPETILNKPGRLTDDEFTMMKQHSTYGYEMIKDVYDKKIAKIILQHHERLDGSGYPHGLKGEEILLEAKIIGIADTYDAMTSDRVYRKGMNPIIAIEELKRLSGIHYDKEIVDAFERVLMEEGVLTQVEETHQQVNG